jgi:PAS domain S-box-containing protein
MKMYSTMEISKSHQHLRSFLESNNVVGLAEALFDRVPGVLFFVKDCQRRFVYVNQSLSDLFGLSRKADVIGKYDSAYCDEYVESMFKKDDESILKHGVHIRNKIELVTTMNGALKWHITNKIPIYKKSGDICGIAGVTREYEDDRIKQPREHVALDEVIRFIGEHYAEELSTQRLAGIAGLSISALGRNFKKTFHITPAQYISRYRVQQACRLLSQSGRSMASIAHDCGFCDQSHFNRIFRKIIHATPSSYRRRYRC